MVTVLNHSLIQDKLAKARSKQTQSSYFRSLLADISALMAYEIAKELPTSEVVIETPLAKCREEQFLSHGFAVVPVLRAGLGMMNGFLEVFPDATIGFIGLARDEKTCKPREYYRNLPDSLSDLDTIIVDPMLATGGSLSAAAELIAQLGPKSLKVVCLVAAPEGIALFEKRFPEVQLFVAAIDEGLDEKGYIIPGLGDAGDRLFNT